MNQAPNTDVYDISNESVADTTTIDLDRPNGDPMLNPEGKQCSVTIYGPGSREFQKAQSARNRAVLAFVKKGGKKMADDDQREIDAEFLATCTCSFNNFGYKGLTGRELFKAVYKDTKIGFIADQVNKAVGDWGNFTKESAKS